MAIFGPDISSFQHGVDVSALSDPFVMLKCTEGTYYTDADYPRWLEQAKASKKLVVAYHFVRADEMPGAQALWMKQHIIDMNVPVMLDIETEGSSKPSAAFVVQVADAMDQVGLRVRLAYLPKWYWEQIGRPSLQPLGNRGIGLVASAYPAGSGQAPAAGYLASGGDRGLGWGSYGGLSPVMWQFTDSGLEQQRLDFNAFRGTITELAALLGGSATNTTTVGGVMGSYTMTAGWQNDYPDVAAQLQKHIPAGTVLEESAAAAYGAIRSFVAAERAAVIEAKLDLLLAAKPVGVDAGAIAANVVAAIQDHLVANVDVKAVAEAVQAQLAQALGGHGVG